MVGGSGSTGGEGKEGKEGREGDGRGGHGTFRWAGRRMRRPYPCQVCPRDGRTFYVSRRDGVVATRLAGALGAYMTVHSRGGMI